jgi:hypothetical protein
LGTKNLNRDSRNQLTTVQHGSIVTPLNQDLNPIDTEIAKEESPRLDMAKMRWQAEESPPNKRTPVPLKSQKTLSNLYD